MKMNEFIDQMNFTHDELEVFATKVQNEGIEGVPDADARVVAGIIEGAHIIMCRLRAGGDPQTSVMIFPLPGGRNN